MLLIDRLIVLETKFVRFYLLGLDALNENAVEERDNVLDFADSRLCTHYISVLQRSRYYLNASTIVTMGAGKLEKRQRKRR